MKFDSPLFDKVRVKPDKDRRKKTGGPACEWPGCKEIATNRAPKGKQNDKEYWQFCLAHTREYNQSYNFFAGMNDDAVLAYQKDALTGHRPTWKMGTGKRAGAAESARCTGTRHRSGCSAKGMRAEQQARAEAARPVRNAERKALEALGLEVGATPHAGEDALQGTGETPPSRRQRRRPLDRKPPDRGHQVVQLLEIGRFRLNRR